MKKSFQWAMMAFLIMFFISIWTLYTRYQPKPPELEVIVQEQAVEVEPVTYSLKKWGRAAAADTQSDPIIMVKETEPILVDPSDNVKLLFEQTPESVTYYLWDIETGMLAYKELKGYPLKLEKSKVASGDYAMEIRAKWANGYVLYHTRIIVMNNEE
ncbi:hypothetical protein [Mesobacillus subterraneus]|uniref:Uncharacterized protein n=1 Tax=Mesobacillus subterraneus TaxID=285983 RepID=A0A3R9KT73_9BACI|nr:hypothetical protein [Mesobacillus subterraneus]RSD25533.1 hypothetical protein EJA10_17155 [Mesobacillus subterraneus]